MSEECKKHRASPIVGPHDCPSCAMEKIRGVNYEVSVENQRLRAELAALKAGHGEAVAWRDHSVNYAKGEKCPATIETLQAAWDRDQELLLDQKNVISKLKETINQLRQKRTTPPTTGQCEAVTEVSAETFSSDGTSDIITCNLPIGTKLYLSAQPASATTTGWRCYHCDEHFNDSDSAALHFGTHQHQSPACLIDVAEYRAMEARMHAYNEEDAEIHRAMARMHGQHRTALQREEEKGYARGLKDGATPDAGVNVPSELLEEAIERIELNTHFPFGEPQTPEDAENRKVTDELRALLARSPASAGARLVPVELLERIDGALTRHMDGHAPMRVPVDIADSDIVQAELRALLAQSQEVKS